MEHKVYNGFFENKYLNYIRMQKKHSNGMFSFFQFRKWSDWLMNGSCLTPILMECVNRYPLSFNWLFFFFVCPYRARWFPCSIECREVRSSRMSRTERSQIRDIRLEVVKCLGTPSRSTKPNDTASFVHAVISIYFGGKGVPYRIHYSHLFSFACGSNGRMKVNFMMS